MIGKLELSVRPLDVSADGRWLYAGAQWAAPKVWDLATGELFPLGAERADWAWGAFSPDGGLLLIADQALEAYGTISVWDLQARRKLARLTIAEMHLGFDGFRLRIEPVQIGRRYHLKRTTDLIHWEDMHWEDFTSSFTAARFTWETGFPRWLGGDLNFYRLTSDD